MMAPQQFCVRWNSHQSNLQSAFPKLLTNEHFADVTLACEARSIRCHKVVLSACSAYFESLLVSNPCQHPIVFMKDMRHRDLRALVDFMYRGEVNVSQEELASLLRAAEALQIRGLSGNDQEVATAPLGSLPTNLPPDISVRNGPITPTTGQESPPPGSGSNRRSLHKRRRNLAQQSTSSSSPPVSGDSQRNAPRDDERRGSEDEADAAEEGGESESPRPRTHGEIQVRGDLHEPVGTVDDEALKEEYEDDGGVDLDTVKTEHDYGHQSMDNSAGIAGENEEDLEEEEEEEGDILQTEGEGRPSEHQSVHYHHMLDVPGPSGYTPQSLAPPQEKMMMGEVTDPATLALQSVTCEISPGGWPAMASGMRHIQPMGMGGATVQSPTSPSSIPSPASAAALTNSGTKRIRRSEDELKKAADCVGRGMTFQNVSHIFGIPISTIRFYMARRGILPQRRRGRVQTLRRVVQMPSSPGSNIASAAELHSIPISPQNIQPKVIRTYPSAETKHTPYHQ